MNRIFLVVAMAVMLAACGKEESNVGKAEAKPVADPVAAAQTYYDGTDTAPWIALNKACKDEAASGKRGVNCQAYDVAASKANALIRQNPSGFVGVRVK